MPKAANPAKNTSWKMIQKAAHTSRSRPSIIFFTFDKIGRIYHVDLSRDIEWKIELRPSRLFCGKTCRQLRPLEMSNIINDDHNKRSKCTDKPQREY